MNLRLKKLKELLDSGMLLRRETFEFDDLDEVLDLREDVSFDGEWLRVHEALNERPPESTDDDRVLISTIRQLAYKATYNLTQNPDLAAFVSDDFELISISIAKGYSDPWLKGLWEAYKRGRFPYKEIEQVSGDLDMSK